jgi:hypothetical protein
VNRMCRFHDGSVTLRHGMRPAEILIALINSTS